MEKVKLSQAKKYKVIRSVAIDKVYSKNSIIEVDNIALAISLVNRGILEPINKQIDLEENITQSLHDKYFEKHNKKVPNKYKNNADWIKSKL